MLERVVVGALQLVQQVSGGGRRCDAGPHRHRVDQQAHHRLRAGQLGRPSRDHGAEGHVMLTGQRRQQHRPGALQHDVDGAVTRPRQLAEGPRGVLGHPERCNVSRSQSESIRRTDQGGGVKAGQHLTPDRAGGIAIPTGQPGDEPAIGRGRRAAAARSSWQTSPPAGSAVTSHRTGCGGWSARTGADLVRCGSKPPETQARRPGRTPRRVRRRTPAGSVHRGPPRR